jgi:UDP-N-acetylmuramoyl-tripeptide--D-alanyl-D-alanine ligase
VELQTLTLAEVAEATRGRLVAPGAASIKSIAGVSIDSRTLEPGQLFFAIAGRHKDGHDFLEAARARGAAAAVVHREGPGGEGLPLVRVPDTTAALADLARHRRRAADLPVVAITGSAGKTTTKDMAAALLATRGPVLKTEGNLNNQYGLPLSLLRLAPEHTAAVLELGMSAPGELRHLSRVAEPDLAVITNVGSAHLEFFASPDEIAKAKAEVLEGLRPHGRAVLNAEDPRLRRMGEEWGGSVIWFGRDRRYEVSAENWRGTVFGMRFDLLVGGRKVDVALPLPGTHFMMDFLAAAASAQALGVAADSIAEAASRLRPGRHRGEVCQLEQDVVLYDDCYNSSPEALDAALSALALARGRRRVAVLGDMLELGEGGKAMHRRRGAGLAGRVELLATVGPLARELAEGARGAGLAADALFSYDDAGQAAKAVPLLLEPGDAVLVKGSRGVHLEEVVEAIAARFSRGKA